MDPISAIFVMTILGGLFVKGVDVATDGLLSAEVGAGIRGAGAYTVRDVRDRWGQASAKAREVRSRTRRGRAVQGILDDAAAVGRTGWLVAREMFGGVGRFGSGIRSEWRTARDQARSARTERRGDAPWPVTQWLRERLIRLQETRTKTPNGEPNEAGETPNGDPEPSPFVAAEEPFPTCPDCGMALVVGTLADHRSGLDRCSFADMDDDPDDPNGASIEPEPEPTVTVYDIVLHPREAGRTRADIRVAAGGGMRAWEFLDRPTPEGALEAAVERIHTVHPVETGGPYRIQQSQPWVPPPWPFTREEMVAAVPPAKPLYPDPNGDPNVPLESTVPNENGDVRCGCCAQLHKPLAPGEHCPDCHIHDHPSQSPNAPATKGPSMDINNAPAAIAAWEAFTHVWDSLQSRANALQGEIDTLTNDAAALHGEVATLADGMGDFAVGGEADTAAAVGELSDAATSMKERADVLADSIGTAKQAVDSYRAQLEDDLRPGIEAAAGKVADVHSVMQEA